MKTFPKLLFSALTAYACLAMPTARAQQDTKPMRLVVSLAPGGGTDILARLLAQKLSVLWDRPVLVENRPGGDGVIASELVAKANPDGDTLLLTSPSHVINPALKVRLPYNTLKAFTPITQIATSPFVLMINTQLAARDMKELVSLGKKGRNGFLFGSADPSSRIAGELFGTMAGVKMTSVSYKGSGPVFTDIVGGHIQLAFGSLASAMPFQKQGAIKILAVSTTKRSPLMPDVPTIAESGFPEYDLSAWYGLCAPAGTPSDIVHKIRLAVAQVVAQPDMQASLLKLGATPVASTPEEFDAFIVREIAKSAAVIKSAGIAQE